MNAAISLKPSQLPTFLLHTALVRPVFIWGAPGIGKSALVADFAADLGLDCVSLLGSQLAPEDLLGVPWIDHGVSRFCPPSTIARDKPYCLFLDELNACSIEVQKAFYSLIHERRVGEYHLPEGSVVVGAGNRAQDQAIVRPMPSALINRMIHVHLEASHRDWLAWARGQCLHAWVLEYVGLRPDHLWSQPPKHEEAFSTPRPWHLLSDALLAYGDALDDTQLAALAHGCLTPAHASGFVGFVRSVRDRYALDAIIKGDRGWPEEPEQRDVLYFLAGGLRARLIKELPVERGKLSGDAIDLQRRAKELLKQLSRISFELAQIVVAPGEGDQRLPDWFLVEIVRDLPRLVKADGT